MATKAEDVLIGALPVRWIRAALKQRAGATPLTSASPQPRFAVSHTLCLRASLLHAGAAVV
jgi:hypothetical protein